MPEPRSRPREAPCGCVQPTNTLAALTALVAAALTTWSYEDGDGAVSRCVAAEDVLPLLRGLAVPGRTSDPLIAERVARLAWGGRVVALDHPVGVYLSGFQHGRLRTPDGDLVPPEWLRLSRGTPASEEADGVQRWQRGVLEVPDGLGFDLNDLVNVATEARLAFGGQVAELLQVAVHLRVTERNALPPEPRPAPEPASDSDGGADPPGPYDEARG